MREPTTAEMATSYRTLLWEASQVDSDSGTFTDLMAAGVHIALRIRVLADLPRNAQLREMPYSEVCMHMRVAGEPMWVVLTSAETGPRMAQLYTLDGERFSMPITAGEAGIYLSQLDLMT